MKVPARRRRQQFVSSLAVLFAVVSAQIGLGAGADANVRVAVPLSGKAAPAQAVKSSTRSSAKVAPTAKAVKTAKKPTTKRRTVTTNTTPPSMPTTTIATVEVGSVPAATIPPSGSAIQVVATVPPSDPVTTTIKPPPTTLVPAPFPGPANLPLRLSAATSDPYRGLGTWLDRFDWTTQWSKKPVPPVTAATVDAMWSQGVQTIFVQAAHWSTTPDVLEPEKLQPIIDRAHQLGMYVVVWYLPAFQDVNTDLRKIVAIANLDVDGISIDIEERDIVKDVAERTRRLLSLTQSLRGLLPGRFLTNNIIEPLALDGVPGIWTLPNGMAPPAVAPWWRGPFPYAEIAPAFDLWMIQSYWTNRGVNSGWRDGYRYVTENVNRLRRALNRPDLPVHVIGGVGDRARNVNDISGMLQAAREVSSTGLSFYDWMVTDPAIWQYLRAFRSPGADGQFDARFAAVTPPAYVPSVPPPVTTTTLPPPIAVVTQPPVTPASTLAPPVAAT